MPRFIDLSGARFGSWEVLARAPRPSWWLCRCKCGTKRAVRGDTLRDGLSTQCLGCRKNIPLPEIVNLGSPFASAVGSRIQKAAEEAKQRQALCQAAADNGCRTVVIDGTSCFILRLNTGAFAFVDEADASRVEGFSWRRRIPKNPAAYTTYAGATFMIRRKSYSILLHQIIMPLDQGIVDHRNSDGLDNRRCNLRPASHSLNNANSFIRRTNKTGFKGVQICAGRFDAYISVGGRTRRIGRFHSGEAAARAYDAAALRAFGEFATLNFPNSEIMHDAA